MTSGSQPSGEPGPDVVDLDARRRAHHQELREASEHIVVVLPDTEGELTAVLGRLEELLLADLDGEDDEPIVDAPPDAAGAVGRLASYVGGAERAAPAVQPIAPDGRYELVPLHTVVIGRDDLQRILGAIARLPLASVDTLSGWFGDEQETARFVASAQRLGALLGLPWDEDVGVLHGRLGGMGGRTPVRAVLSEAEYAAYQRVSGRILETWHAGDTLAPFLYRGR